MTDCEIIASSSSGNCIIFKDIMLDCGVTYKKIQDKLKNIKLIYISHSHS